MIESLDAYELSARRIVMYPDLNAAGRLFGGRLMAWMDEACAITAMRIMGTPRIVTKKFGEAVFEAPGLVGDVVEIWCRPLRFGKTSLTLSCKVAVRAVAPERVTPISRSTVVYVALDEHGRPTPWQRGPREGPADP